MTNYFKITRKVNYTKNGEIWRLMKRITERHDIPFYFSFQNGVLSRSLVQWRSQRSHVLFAHFYEMIDDWRLRDRCWIIRNDFTFMKIKLYRTYFGTMVLNSDGYIVSLWAHVVISYRIVGCTRSTLDTRSDRQSTYSPSSVWCCDATGTMTSPEMLQLGAGFNECAAVGHTWSWLEFISP